LLALFERIVGTYCTAPDKGLPIGTLASQYFANSYLDGLDRLLLERLGVLAHARYMDDCVWWCRDAAHARETLSAARDFAQDVCLLEVKETARIDRSERGLAFLGFRVLPGTLRLSQRRRRSYLKRRRHWEREYREGRIDSNGLQRGYAAVHAIVAQADSRGWRAQSLARDPPLDA
jgi:RNA-directed DNA polymerase